MWLLYHDSPNASSLIDLEKRGMFGDIAIIKGYLGVIFLNIFVPCIKKYLDIEKYFCLFLGYHYKEVYYIYIVLVESLKW